MKLQPPGAPLPTTPVHLPSAGLGEKRATKHEFVRYESVDPSTLKLSSDDKEPSPRGRVALIYRCAETGAERRWGIE
jgi:hypothetical protein